MLTRSDKIGSDANAIVIVGVIVVSVAVVIDISEIGSGARIGRPQPCNRTFRTEPG